MPNLLQFVEKSHPILREVMPVELDFKDPVLHQVIEDMCYSILPEQLQAVGAAHRSAAGMAANQWGIKRRVFLFTPDGCDNVKKAQVMINPSYAPYLRPREKFPECDHLYEGCFSVPLTTGIVKRYTAIVATYYTPAGEKVQCIMRGWEARVFQHETDHLDGKLFDGICDNHAGPECADRVIFQNREEMDAFWNR
ncbi:MAG TPA: peptide deformylase [Gammaproteobacteria bacterium]|jgi:peptide deformylase|nr:peptide deformylase [Gammaproteobacteria bacterium]